MIHVVAIAIATVAVWQLIKILWCVLQDRGSKIEKVFVCINFKVHVTLGVNGM
jgi:hypothetical protein